MPPFDTPTAVAAIERELGGPLAEFFTEISEEPVAAASLAQVYKATLRSSGKTVAVKVQRPEVLQGVSKDLYVLRRAVEVVQVRVESVQPQHGSQSKVEVVCPGADRPLRAAAAHRLRRAAQ